MKPSIRQFLPTHKIPQQKNCMANLHYRVLYHYSKEILMSLDGDWVRRRLMEELSTEHMESLSSSDDKFSRALPGHNTTHFYPQTIKYKISFFGVCRTLRYFSVSRRRKEVLPTTLWINFATTEVRQTNMIRGLAEIFRT